jgi:hypothetical protein
MKSNSRYIILPSCIVIFLFLVFNGCEMKEMGSRWCDRKITIDGIDSGAEWENARYFFDEAKVTVGLMNTESMLYVRLSSRDPRIQSELLSLGFTIWFDEKGGDKKVLGIHYPLKSQGAGRPMMRGNLRIDPGNTASQIDTLIQSIPDEIELVGPGKGESFPLSFVDAGKCGILCQIGYSGDNLVYELQYPLQRTDACPYGISVNQIRYLGISFETGKMNTSQKKQPEQDNGRLGRGDMEPGSGMIGGSGGMSGMRQRNRMRSGPGLPVPEQLELQIKVTLAEHGAIKS